LSNNSINQFVTNQFPARYLSEGPNFVAFAKAYYEWLEQSGNPIWFSRNFNNITDIDNTLAEFIIHFKNEFMADMPTNIVADQRLLIKHITDLYAAKGSKRGYELLFRILFDEDIQLYIPSDNIFKLSDNTWVVGGYVEVTDSVYLQNLIGMSIYSSDGATALVEDFNVININNKVINVLHLSNINGVFNYGDQILSTDVPELTVADAPLIVGSLSSVTIENGGIFFNVGDIVNVVGSGAGGLGKVTSVTFENGKVVFNLINGGYGYTLNPSITVSGGGGDGATFSVGSIINQSTYQVNIDTISTYYNTQLDIASEGFILNVSNVVGTFLVGETVNTTVNAIGIDFAYINGSNNLALGESLSNTSLGISALFVQTIDNPNYLNATATADAMLTNANLVSGVTLIGSSGNTIYVNSIYNKTAYTANGTVTATNSTTISVNNANGYFMPSSNIYGQTSAASAYDNSTVRLTNWNFPVAGNTNLDTPMWNVLTYETLTVGTISRLIHENPGENYRSNATVSIIEPLIYQLQIPDGSGGVWGGDANVTATSLNANGIMTSVAIIDSGFGFEPDEQVSLFSNNNYSATGFAVVNGTGVSPGYWENNKSFLSDTNYLQDSYYYQVFSYEILAARMLDTYSTFVNDLVHPVGYQMFGRLKIKDQQDVSSSLVFTETIQTYSNGSNIITES
jgi:hypothetical protein